MRKDKGIDGDAQEGNPEKKPRQAFARSKPTDTL